MKLHLPKMLRKAVLAGGLVSTLTTGALFGGAFAVSMAGRAVADTPVWDFSTSVTEGDYLYDASTGLFTDNTAVAGTVLNDTNSSNQIQTNICFVLNLTQAEKSVATSQIIRMDMPSDLGLTITATGLSTTWTDKNETNGRGSVTWDALKNSDGYNAFINTDGDLCVTLTFVESYASGVQIWDDTSKLINDSGLKSSGNTTLTGIYVKSDYIEALQFAPGWEGDGIVNTNKSFADAAREKLAAKDFYWESDATEWNGAKWAIVNDGDANYALPQVGTVNAIFNNNETAIVTMDGAVTVTSMSIDAGKYTFQGSSAAEDSLTVGTLSVKQGATASFDHIAITPTNAITNAGTLTISNSDVDFAIINNSRLNITNATIDGASASITGSGSVQLSGTINLKNFTGTVGQEVIPTTSNGFGSITTTYKVVSCTAGSSADSVNWQINGTKVQGTISYSESGVLSVSENGTVYYVSVDEVAYDAGSDFDGATSLALNGGTLTIDTAEELAAGFITSTEKGGTINLNGRKLAQRMLGTLGAETTLRGAIGSIYDIGDDMALATNLILSESDWKGTITMGDVTTPEADLDITAFGKNQSSVLLGQVDVNSLQSGSSATVGAHALALGGGHSSVGGTLSVLGPLTLGNATSAAVLNVGGQLNAAEGVTLGNAGSALIVGSLSALSLKIEDTAVLNELCSFARTGAITLITVTDAATGADPASVNLLYKGKPVENSPGSKYTIHSGWSGNAYQMTATTNENYVTERLQPTSPNAVAGASMLSDAFIASDPQVNAPDSDLAAILNAVDAGTVGNEQAAAVAGASTAALGMAFSGDVERQLRAIRNRTTTMGVNECVINEGMPYFNAWINGEGNRGELDKDGTMAGYTLDSWGGTVGFDVDVNPNLTLGMAVTAMYGDVTVDGPDTLDGDMDTYYVSAFARYAKRAWTHTFVATVGTMDSSYERTVRYGSGSYMTKGDTDGMAFGLMYELARTFTLDRDGDVGGQLVANVAYRHTTVDGYAETGRDAALKVDDQTLDTITFGVGGRMQAVVGKNMFNRTSVFEARALAKLDVGDRSSEADVAFLGGRKTATVESAELGAFGVELGAGLSIPVGDEEDGTIFFDVSAELRSGYTNVNGTVGYRINF